MFEALLFKTADIRVDFIESFLLFSDGLDIIHVIFFLLLDLLDGLLDAD